jgi:hypothetical protein
MKEQKYSNEIIEKIKQAMSEDRSFYIAYGSNINIEQMKMRCPNTIEIMEEVLTPYEITFRQTELGSFLDMDMSARLIDNCYVMRTPVVIYALTKEDEQRLDGFEHYPDIYIKKNVVFVVDKGLYLSCYYYTLKEKTPYGKPSDKYVNICKKGYENHNFDQSILLDALKKVGE